MFDGLNARLIMHTCVPVGVQLLPPPPPPYVGESLPQPSNAEKAPMTRMTRFRIGVLPPGSANRGGGIRTRDLLVPNQARYRTAPHPDANRRLDAEMPRRRGEAKDLSGYGATVMDCVSGV